MLLLRQPFLTSSYSTPLCRLYNGETSQWARKLTSCLRISNLKYNTQSKHETAVLLAFLKNKNNLKITNVIKKWIKEIIPSFISNVSHLGVSFALIPKLSILNKFDSSLCLDATAINCMQLIQRIIDSGIREIYSSWQHQSRKCFRFLHE